VVQTEDGETIKAPRGSELMSQRTQPGDATVCLGFRLKGLGLRV
jgi:hypothetical protein